MSEHGGQKKAKEESNEYKLFEMFAQNKVLLNKYIYSKET